MCNVKGEGLFANETFAKISTTRIELLAESANWEILSTSVLSSGQFLDIMSVRAAVVVQNLPPRGSYL